MHPQSKNQDDANVPIWPSMDSILPTNLDSGSGGQQAAPNGTNNQSISQQESRLRVANAPAQPVYDDRLPGAPPLPAAAPTPVPSNVPAPHTGSVAVRPGERAAALAARTNVQESLAPDVPGGSWNQPNALVSTNAEILEAEGDGPAHNQAKLVSMPTLNKVKLPDPTSIVKTLTTPVRNPTGLVEQAGKSDGSNAPSVTKEEILAASKPKTASVPVKRTTAPVAVAPSPEDSSHQLALQIIFGFEGVLNREEVLDLAKDLDGVKKIRLVGGSEAAAFDLLKDSAREYEFGDKEGAISLRSGDHNLEFIGDERLCLCIVLEKPTLPKASREKLTLIAREAARLSE